MSKLSTIQRDEGDEDVGTGLSLQKRKIFVLNKEKAFGLWGSFNIYFLSTVPMEQPCHRALKWDGAFAADSSTNVAGCQVFGSLTRGLVAPTKRMRRRDATKGGKMASSRSSFRLSTSQQELHSRSDMHVRSYRLTIGQTPHGLCHGACRNQPMTGPYW